MELATFGITTPNFVVAPLLSLLFGMVLGILPAGGWLNDDPHYWILPIVTLALPQVAVIARLVRGAMVEALRANHVRIARAYGLPTHVVVGVHALRAAILPAVSYLGPTAASVMREGRVVEEGATAEIFDSPRDAYTRDLMAAAVSKTRFA